MADQFLPQASMGMPGTVVYSQQATPAFEAEMAARTASHEAAFLLPYLRPGMQLLDVGCGPGSITLGLAAVVAPGQVVGIDIQAAQVKRARALAAAHGVATVGFEVADLYALPFPDASFDGAFANGVLMHLREPVRALVELRRVLRPGGIAGVRDPDLGASLCAPTTPLLEQWLAMRVQVRPQRRQPLHEPPRSPLLVRGRVHTCRGQCVRRECGVTGGDPPPRRLPQGPAPGLRADGSDGRVDGASDARRSGG